MSTIQTDVAVDHEAADDAADAFSKVWGLDADDNQPSDDTTDEPKKKKPATEQDEDTTADDNDADADDETSEETPEGDDDNEGDEDEGDDDEGSQSTVEIKDEHKIKVTVDGEEREFTLGSLKRLAGQEAALTRKGQEVANTRKALETQTTAQMAQYNVLLARAKAKYEPLAKIDLLAASKDPNVSAEELVAARNAINSAYEDVKFLEQEMSTFAQAVQHQQRTDLMEQAKEAIKVLSDPEKGIEGWSESLYGEIRSFAVDSGLPTDLVNNLVDPTVIKLLNMARLYAKGKTKVQSEKSDKKKAPKRIVKSTSTAENTKKVTKTAKAQEPMKRLQKSGSVDDAADAFMARWSSADDE